MSTAADYDTLVHALYQGIFDDTPWQAFLPRLRAATDALAVSLILRPPAENDPGLILNAARDGAITLRLADPGDHRPAAYRERFFAFDPFVNLPADTVVSLAELMPRAALLGSDYYRQYLAPIGVLHILGADTTTPEGLHASLRLSRGPDERAFGRRERLLCERLLPHLARAIRIHGRLNRMASERAVYASAVDRLAVASLLLDDQGRVLDCNSVAQQLLDERDGLLVQDQRLQLSDRRAQQTLQGLIAAALSTRQQQETTVVRTCRVPRPSGRRDLGLILRPVPLPAYADAPSAPAIAVFLRDPEQNREASAGDLASLFGLTPAEAALALALAGGLSIADAAGELGISPHTARAQLKSVFAKTGASRQAELVRLILKSAAPLA